MDLHELVGLDRLPADLGGDAEADWREVLRHLVRQAVRVGIVPRGEWWASWSLQDRRMWLEEVVRRDAALAAQVGLACQSEEGRAQVMALVDGGEAMLDLLLYRRALDALGKAHTEGA